MSPPRPPADGHPPRARLAAWCALAIGLASGCSGTEPIEDYGAFPPFTLVTQDGPSFSDGDLEGRLHVFHFFFTRCRAICPRLMEAASELRRRCDESGLDTLRLAGVSVDPDHDSPARLRAYGETWGAGGDRWVLLTGDTVEVRRLADALKLPLGGSVEVGPNLVDIAHTGKFVLVDSNRRIRGYFDGDSDDRERLVRTARRLLHQAEETVR